MNWGSGADFWSNFWHMGGYGLYVWGAYSVTAALMLAEPLLAAQRRRRALHAADAAEVTLETHTA